METVPRLMGMETVCMLPIKLWNVYANKVCPVWYAATQVSCMAMCMLQVKLQVFLAAGTERGVSDSLH